jgi:hypothetical protein
MMVLYHTKKKFSLISMKDGDKNPYTGSGGSTGQPSLLLECDRERQHSEKNASTFIEK